MSFLFMQNSVKRLFKIIGQADGTSITSGRKGPELSVLMDGDICLIDTESKEYTAIAKKLIGAADIGSSDTTKVTPRNDLEDSDFGDIWLVGDYSDKNGAENGGYIAIKLLNALSTGGFKLQTSDKAKGQFAFEFTGHYSMSAQDTVPFELYIKAGTAEQ